MSDNGQTMRRERKDTRRNMQLVLDAAHALFAERGNDVTMEQVARRAGVGVGTIYRRFPSKEHLFAAVSQAACDRTRHSVDRAALSDQDPLNRLRALVIAVYEHGERQSGLIDLQPAPSDQCYTSETHQLYAALHITLQQIIAEGQQQGIFQPGDPVALAAFCLELLNPRTLAHLKQATGNDTVVVAEQAVQFLLYGLGTCAKGAPDCE